MLQKESHQELQKILPKVEGRYEFGTPLKNLTWFKVGGPAEVIFKPASTKDLSNFMANKPKDLTCFTMGVGSNLLVRDGGLPGCTIRLINPEFSQIDTEGNLAIIGAGCLDRTVALTLRDHGLAGLEFLVGIPGTMGGAIAMNAGAYDGEIKDRLAWIEVVDENGKQERIEANALNMTYRKGNLPKGTIVTKAAFICEPMGKELIHEKINDFLQRRDSTQPTKARTGGSTFKNPPHELKAWQLIDKAGCRGLMVGDAQMSDKHCNFMLNLGGASANDLETLGELVRTTVLKKTGVELKWEVLRIGMRNMP